MRRGVRMVAGIIVGAAALLLLQQATAVNLPGPGRGGEAWVRLSWSARPERVETCRRLTDAELADRPAHMRLRLECTGRFARYRLAVLTNGNADVRRLGLADYFQFALCAEELGVGKPDPLPFREALRRAGVAPGEAVHVGDHPLDDIQGARAAGLRAIWYNPRGLAWQGEAAPDAQISRLDQLPQLLAHWSAI